jgi:hypothetical protein
MKKKLIALISTKGKSKKQIIKEASKAYKKYRSPNKTEAAHNH